MKRRRLGSTDLTLPILSLGTSSLGAQGSATQVAEALESIPAAIECGMNFIDTSPFYERGGSEVLLGMALADIPRDKYMLGSKLGRYDVDHFDFSEKRVRESVDVSLRRLRVDYLDLMLCHDVEFANPQQIVNETIPALRKIQQTGKVRCVGISAYPLKAFKQIIDQCELDCILSYNNYHLQNRRLARLVPYLRQRDIGIINAAPFYARLLTPAPLPSWHKASERVRAAAQQAIGVCEAFGIEIAQLAMQFAIGNPDVTTCVAGSVNEKRIRQWAEWAQAPINTELLARVEAVFAPVMDEVYLEGRPENN